MIKCFLIERKRELMKESNDYVAYCGLNCLFQIVRYGVYEDIIIFSVGVYSLVLLIINWKIKNHPANSS